MSRSRIFLLLAAVVGLVTVALVFTVRDTRDSTPTAELLDAAFDPAGLQVVALDSDASGIAPDSAFILTSDSRLTTGQVRHALRVRPETELRIERTSSNEFRLRPADALAEDSVFRVEFAGNGGEVLASWAYQVQAPLRVVSTVPDDERTNVPLNVGIEVTFSHDGVVRPEDFVEITPRPEGRFEQHKRTLVYVPSRLEEYTLYTVRVKPGVTVQGTDLVLQDEFVYQFETGGASRGLGPVPAVSFLTRLNSASTKEAPLLDLQSFGPPRDVQVEVYRYGGLGAFLGELDRLESIPPWANWAFSLMPVDLSRLTLAASFTTTVADMRQNLIATPTSYIRLPEALSAGYYLVRVLGDRPANAWLQVTDLAAYVALGQKQSLVWVNQVGGGSVAGASVERPGVGKLGSTDGQGIARFQTPAEAVQERDAWSGGFTGKGYFVIRDGSGQAHVAPLSPVLYQKGRYYSPGYTFMPESGDYWVVVTTDRPVYQPTDTIRFWGVAKPRDGKPEIDVKLSVRGSNERGPVQLAVSKAVRTSSSGSFEGELTYEGLGVGSYRLELRHGDSLLWSNYFTVRTYTKPAYRVRTTTDRIAYFAGEQMRLAFAATFFEGTPVAGLELRMGDTTVTTALDGRTETSIPTTLRESERFGYAQTQYQMNWLSFSAVGPEETEVGASATVAVFPSAIGMRTATKYENGVITLTGDAFVIDAGRVKSWTDLVLRPPGGGDPELPPYASGVAANQEITVQVREVSQRKIETGEAYDFVSKRSVKTYRYEQVEEHIDTRTVRAGADGRFRYDLPTAEDHYYGITLWTDDSAGRRSGVRTSAYSRAERPWSYGGQHIGLYFREDMESSGQYSGGVFQGPGRSFQLGDTVEAVLKRSPTEDLPSGGENRYLFYEAQRGLLPTFVVQDSPGYSFRFDEGRLPGVTVKAVYYNGSSYIEPGPEGSGMLQASFNPSARRLNVELTPEQGSYGPGDEASVLVRVTDAEGKPVRAEVNIAAVDEALFAVRDFSTYELDILSRLYRFVQSGLVRTYASHAPPPAAIIPAPRTGGGDVPRTSFLDTASVQTVRTDASGRATMKLKLPDNLTTWRLTGLALTGDLHAGTGQGAITVKRDFFVDVGLGTQFLVGDQPYVRVRAFGDALGSGDRVRFEVEAPSLGVASPLTGEAEAFRAIDLPLPALVEGEHEVLVRATAGSRTDALVRKVQVARSRLTRTDVRYVEDVRSAQDLQVDSPGRVTVTFVDGGRAALHSTLRQLADTYGDRVDQAAARLVAGRLLTRYFDEPARPESFDAAMWAPRQGSAKTGISLLPFTGPDVVVTARMSAVAADVLGRDGIAQALRAAAADLKETSERHAIALYGLAALGEPVLNDLRSLESEPTLGWRGRLYVGLAYEAAGDDQAAKRVLDGLAREFGEDIAPYWRLRVGVDQDDVLEANALASVIAAGVGDDRADALWRYVRTNRTKDAYLVIEELLYTQKRLERLPAEPARFTVTAGGQTTEVRLDDGRTKSWSLSPSELKALRVDVQEGRLGASVYYQSPLTASDLSVSPDLAVRRTIQPAAGNLFTQSGLVKITLNVRFGAQAPDGCYQLDDVLPAGLRATTRYGAGEALRSPFERVVYPYRVEGQRVSFCLTKQNETVVYYARPVGKGTFRAEPALLFHQRAPDVVAVTEAQEITIE